MFRVYNDIDLKNVILEYETREYLSDKRCHKWSLCTGQVMDACYVQMHKLNTQLRVSLGLDANTQERSDNNSILRK